MIPILNIVKISAVIVTYNDANTHEPVLNTPPVAA